ncbi:site-specific integrase [Pseudochryseolinea flava]|uniref:Site-specific integrase n=1 Tax=Pseudochryseolinea flava TaxID=2059302 RepID=A0A364Y522_9BACT|nr:site-specific integrase [Pseudochryseolinea flava]RAW01171.1 site-specific integrase [Pseudochryseolinea flava]
MNHEISVVKSELINVFNQLKFEKAIISAEIIKNKYLGVEVKKFSLLDTISFHNADLHRRIGTNFSKATWTKFNTLYSKVECFIKEHLKRRDVALYELGYSFATESEYFLRSKNLGHNISMKYIRMLKKILNESVRKVGYKENPLAEFKCTFKWKEREVLTWPELVRIKEKHFAMKRLELVKDYFIFSFFTGLAYVDVVKLSRQSVIEGVGGKRWLTFERQKSKIEVRLPLLSEPENIIKKYDSHPEAAPRGKVFPSISNQKMNSYLKEIAAACDISKELTFHLARHTFATTVSLSNGVPIESVSKMLGHTKISTTQIYAKVVQQKLSDDMDALPRKVSKILNKEDE